MKNNPLKSKIFLLNQGKGYLAGDKVIGNITATPSIDLDINFFGFRIFYEQRGQLEPKSKIYKTVYLANNVLWKANETYTFPFNFIAIEPTTYYGENVQLTWNVETIIRLNENSKEHIRKQSIKSFQLLKAINPERNLSQQITYNLIHPESLKINPGSFKLKRKSLWDTQYTFLVAVIFIAMVGIKTPIIAGVFIAIGVFSLIFLFINNNISSYIFGDIEMIIPPSETRDFKLDVTFTKNAHLLRHANTYLCLYEKVIDRRGTSEATYDKLIRSLPHHTINAPTNKVQFQLAQPADPRLPATYYEDDVTLYWKIHLDLKMKIDWFFSYEHIVIMKY